MNLQFTVCPMSDPHCIGWKSALLKSHDRLEIFEWIRPGGSIEVHVKVADEFLAFMQHRERPFVKTVRTITSLQKLILDLLIRARLVSSTAYCNVKGPIRPQSDQKYRSWLDALAPGDEVDLPVYEGLGGTWRLQMVSRECTLIKLLHKGATLDDINYVYATSDVGEVNSTGMRIVPPGSAPMILPLLQCHPSKTDLIEARVAAHRARTVELCGTVAMAGEMVSRLADKRYVVGDEVIYVLANDAPSFGLPAGRSYWSIAGFGFAPAH